MKVYYCIICSWLSCLCLATFKCCV